MVKCEIDEKRRIENRAPNVGRYMDKYNHTTKQKNVYRGHIHTPTPSYREPTCSGY